MNNIQFICESAHTVYCDQFFLWMIEEKVNQADPEETQQAGNEYENIFFGHN